MKVEIKLLCGSRKYPNYPSHGKSLEILGVGVSKHKIYKGKYVELEFLKEWGGGFKPTIPFSRESQEYF